MRKVFILWVLSLFTISAKSQYMKDVSFDTNGPVGECLFPEKYQAVINTDVSADTIMGLAKEFLYSISKKYKANTYNEMEGITKVACDLELKVGKKHFILEGPPIPSTITWDKAPSTISFSLLIEIRNKKYRYTLSNFFTDRYRIPGEGKDKGPSNLIHWQRVNSLTKEMPRKGSKREEYENLISFEKEMYQAEYNAVQDVIKGLENFTKISDDF